jgi:hypothetical protein
LAFRDGAHLGQPALRVELDANEHIKPVANLRQFLLSNKLRPLDPSLKRKPDEVAGDIRLASSKRLIARNRATVNTGGRR